MTADAAELKGFEVLDHLKCIKPTPVFNPEGDDTKEHRLVWHGNTTNLMNLNNVRYDWAFSLWQQMRSNFWIANKIDLISDVTDYKDLTNDERRAFNGILSYLTFLDSVQACNIPHLKLPITAPELNSCFGEQLAQELEHNRSYQVMIETLVPTEKERNDVYDFWRTDTVLLDRCENIAKLYQNYIDVPTVENYYIALVADYLLEGLYFYNGFMFFYTLASRSLCPGSADMIRLIHRDELGHVRLFQNLLPLAKNQLLKDSNVLEDKVYELFDYAVQHEIKWTSHIVNDAVLGITYDSTEKYTKWLANTRLKAIGLNHLYEGYTINPYRHLEKFADLSKDAGTKANFFESGVTAYNTHTVVKGWSDF